MNEKAEFGVAAHWIYKGKINPKDGKQYRWMRQILDILDQSNEPESFLNTQKCKCMQIRFLFLHQGDIVALPKGAMPLGFLHFLF